MMMSNSWWKKWHKVMTNKIKRWNKIDEDYKKGNFKK